MGWEDVVQRLRSTSEPVGSELNLRLAGLGDEGGRCKLLLGG